LRRLTIERLTYRSVKYEKGRDCDRMIALGLGIGTAFSQTGKIGDILLAHPWAPPMTGPKLTNSAAYMRLTDQGTKPDELISASTPVAQKVELHSFNVENGVYGMHIGPLHMRTRTSSRASRQSSARC
jgi:copper(I)-binding protein